MIQDMDIRGINGYQYVTNKPCVQFDLTISQNLEENGYCKIWMDEWNVYCMFRIRHVSSNGILSGGAIFGIPVAERRLI